MGRPKAFLAGPDGRPFVQLALDALRAAGADPLLLSVGPDPAPFAAWAGQATLVVDQAPGQGPLAGLEAALRACPAEWALVVACDMPGLDPALLAEIARQAAGSSAQAVVPRVADQLEPLHAAYRRECAALAEAALARGQRSLHGFLGELDLLTLELPPGPSFRNVNRPEELEG